MSKKQVVGGHVGKKKGKRGNVIQISTPDRTYSKSLTVHEYSVDEIYEWVRWGLETTTLHKEEVNGGKANGTTDRKS